MGASLGNTWTRTLYKPKLDSNTEHISVSISKPGTISGAEVYLDIESGAPTINTNPVDIIISYQVIDHIFYRSIVLITDCGHQVVLELTSVEPSHIYCNCEQGCLTEFQQTYNKNYKTNK